MVEFNFKSQIATTIEQSERLIALGLKKETADICLQSTLNDVWSPYIPIAMPYSKVEALDLSKDVFRIIPAWSLHRLIEMIQSVFERVNIYGLWVQIERRVFQEEYYGKKYNNLYENLIDCIEWLINRGYLSKEYLV